MSLRPFARVFWCPTAIEAHFVRTVLEAEEVAAQVRNESMAPYVPAEVWVPRDQRNKALEVLRELARAGQIDAQGALSEVPQEPNEPRDPS